VLPVEAPELIRNVMLMFAQRHQIDTHRLDSEAKWNRFALGLIFGGVSVLVMMGSGTVNDI